MKKAIVRTDYEFPGQKNVYHGKVRDVYNINDELMVMVAQTAFRPSTWCSPEVSLTKGRC